MRQGEQVARYCRLCGRALEGTECLTGTCVRCKSLGSAESTLDVQQAFERALAGYHPKRASLLASRIGTWAFVFALVVVAWAAILSLATGDPARAVRLTVTALAPLEVLSVCMAVAALFERGTDRTLAALAIVISGAALAIFTQRVASVAAGLSDQGAGVRAIILELLK